MEPVVIDDPTRWVRTPAEVAVARLDQVRRVLAEAKRLDEIKDVRDLAVAAKAYAKQRGLGLEVQNQAAEIRLVAERRMGEILAASRKNRGRAGPGRGKAGSPAAPALPDAPPTYREIGIGKKEAARAQKFARVDEVSFVAALDALRAAGHEITIARVRQALAASRRNTGDPGTPTREAEAGDARALLRRARGLILRAAESPAVTDLGRAQLETAVQLVDEVVRSVGTAVVLETVAETAMNETATTGGGE